MQLKICGLNDQQNIEDILLLEPHFIGLIFFKQSKRYVGDDASFARFTKNISSAKKVGVFVDPSYEEVVQAIADYGLDHIQLHGNESVDFCYKVNKLKPVITSFGISDTFNFEMIRDYEGACTYFLFDTLTKEHGGSGEQFDWSLLNNYKCCKKFFLSGGIGLNDVSRIKKIQHPSLIGIDINSRFENIPGIKNIEKIKKMIYEIYNR